MPPGVRKRLLAELAVELEALGGQLVTRVGEAVDVFERLHTEHPFDRIVCHQETGNYLTHMRIERFAAGQGSTESR